MSDRFDEQAIPLSGGMSELEPAIAAALRDTDRAARVAVLNHMEGWVPASKLTVLERTLRALVEAAEGPDTLYDLALADARRVLGAEPAARKEG